MLYKSIHELTHLPYVTWRDILALQLAQCFGEAYVQYAWLSQEMNHIYWLLQQYWIDFQHAHTK